MKPIYTIESLEDGVVERVLIEEDSYVYEWEDLFLIKTFGGKSIHVSVGASGHISRIHVKAGDQVTKHSLLALLQDDFVISGSD